jgi:hypothetical protein
MTHKIVIPALVAASLLGAMGFAPIVASALEDYLTIDKAVVVFNPRNDNMLVGIDTAGKIPRTGAFGYGIITNDGNALTVATTHAGVLDSELQKGNKDSPRWHNHFVQLNNNQDTVPADCAPNSALNDARLEVMNLTFESPGVVGVVGSKIGLAAIPDEFDGTHGLTHEPLLDLVRGEDPSLAVSFTLKPLGLNADGIPEHVCVENVSPVTPRVLN